MATTDADAARTRVAGLDWWHTIEVAPGVVTPGDLRDTAEWLPWPPSLIGMRCLDIGTMDGSWAFELERRRAGEVVASDVLDAKRLDHFVADRTRRVTSASLFSRPTLLKREKACASPS